MLTATLLNLFIITSEMSHCSHVPHSAMQISHQVIWLAPTKGSSCQFQLWTWWMACSWNGQFYHFSGRTAHVRRIDAAASTG